MLNMFLLEDLRQPYSTQYSWPQELSLQAQLQFRVAHFSINTKRNRLPLIFNSVHTPKGPPLPSLCCGLLAGAVAWDCSSGQHT